MNPVHPPPPPREPPNTEQVKVEKVVSEVPIDLTKKLQGTLDNEMWRLRNEMNH